MTLAFALVVMQGIHLYRGEAAEAVSMGDEMVALCARVRAEAGNRVGPLVPGGGNGGARALDEGIDQLKDSLAVQQAMDAGLVRPAFLALLAEMLWRAGRDRRRTRSRDEGFAHAERTLEGGYVAELHRVQGQLFDFAGNRDAAEDAFRAALEYARGQKAKSFELRAAERACPSSCGRQDGTRKPTPRSRRCTNRSPRATTPPIC